MKRRVAKLTLLIGGVLGTACFLLYPSKVVSADTDPDLVAQRIRVGLSISPVTMNMKGRNPALVGLGSYLVNAVGSCSDCHSCPTYTPGHNPFPAPLGTSGDGQINPVNYLAGGVPFALPPPFNTVLSANITPDANGKPAGMTMAGFVSTIRTGHPADNPSETLVVMPWPQLRKMTDADLAAIYEYLSSIPPAQPGTCFAAGS